VDTQVTSYLRPVADLLHQCHSFPLELLGVGLSGHGHIRTSLKESYKGLNFLSSFSGEEHNDQIALATERANILEKEVLLDALTEIHNRRAYELQIRENLRRYHLDGQSFSLVLIDVDGFKNINDNYGHSAGDKCLREIAKLIRSSLRKTDFLGRYGGEELIAIMEGASAEDGRKIAEKIRSRIERAHFSYQQEEIPVTISLGVTEVMQTDKDSETPFSRADNAMYQAKRQGRNRVCVM
jgi:diguanylate cyclase (GGDEF)-like protein